MHFGQVGHARARPPGDAIIAAASVACRAHCRMGSKGFVKFSGVNAGINPYIMIYVDRSRTYDFMIRSNIIGFI